MAKAKPVTGLDIHAPTLVNARIIAQTRLSELYSWAEYVDNPYYVRELHNLRIAAKRLRYTLEIFADTLPPSVAPFREEVEQLQEELGALHDSDVMVALLRLCLGAHDAGSSYAYALAQAAQPRKPRKALKEADFVVNPDMVGSLLDPASAPSVTERQGLEVLLLELRQQREAQYAAFRQHWYSLQAQDFRGNLLEELQKEL